MSLRCALKILEEKGFINIKYTEKRIHSKLPRCPYYTISSNKPDLIAEIHTKIVERTDCICSNSIEGKYIGNKRYDFFDFTEIGKVDRWLEENCKEEETQIIKCEKFISEYIKNCTDYCQTSDCNGYLILNRKLRKERILKEKKEEKEAIELFESML